ncbi:MAG: histone deacetylase [Actinobacteria bacterium]|nr:histone deacetylase [Actinomycetota bacterium]
MLIIYDDFFLKHNTGYFHPENSARLEAVKKFIHRSELVKKIKFIKPSSATVDQVCMVHDRDYVARIKKLSESGTVYHIDADTVISPYTYDCAMLAVGGCLKGIDFLLHGKKIVKTAKTVKNTGKDNIDGSTYFKDQGYFFALVRPPGHHAFPSTGSGFCIFNNISVAAKYSINHYGLSRVAIIDFDVHHGNGTQDIFYADKKVFYTSIHQYPHYPQTGYWTETGTNDGEYYNLNIPVMPYSEEPDYIIAFTDIIIPLLYGYQPELILVSAGFDAHEEDPLSSINLKDLSFYKMMKLIIYLKKMINLKNKGCCHGIGLFLEGGYASQATARSVLKVIEACVEDEESSDKKEEPGFTEKGYKRRKYPKEQLPEEHNKAVKIDSQGLKARYLSESEARPGLNLINLKTFDNIKNIFNLSQVQ